MLYVAGDGIVLGQQRHLLRNLRSGLLSGLQFFIAGEQVEAARRLHAGAEWRQGDGQPEGSAEGDAWAKFHGVLLRGCDSLFLPRL